MTIRIATLAGVALLATAAVAAGQSKGYRAPSPSPPRSQASAPSAATSPVPKSTLASAKSSSTQKAPESSKVSPSELQKTIGAETRQIDAYRQKVSNPRASYPKWDSLSREQQGSLLRQWNDEIRRHETSRATAQRTLSQKTR